MAIQRQGGGAGTMPRPLAVLTGVVVQEFVVEIVRSHVVNAVWSGDDRRAARRLRFAREQRSMSGRFLALWRSYWRKQRSSRWSGCSGTWCASAVNTGMSRRGRGFVLAVPVVDACHLGVVERWRWKVGEVPDKKDEAAAVCVALSTTRWPRAVQACAGMGRRGQLRLNWG